MPTNSPTLPIVLAGVPKTNYSLYHRTRFLVGDPTSFIQLTGTPDDHTMFICRDIELQRAAQYACADRVSCPADHSPAAGLSGDRETATAQATAEYLTKHAVTEIITDRTLPFIFAYHIEQAGIKIQYSPTLGVMERRAKDDQEVQWLQDAQSATESAMRVACEIIARATADKDGNLLHGGEILTSEILRSIVDIFLLEQDYANPRSIIACGPLGADCHNYGTGPLRTEQPIIVDIFPQNRRTLYNGDCTRTVVNGTIDETIQRMHTAVCEANSAGCSTVKAGVTGEDVHRATIQVIKDNGYSTGLPGPDDPISFCSMTHGTGHAVGLDVHEPPLLDFGGPELIVGDCLTIEPGLYCRAIGGVRVEDMVITTTAGCLKLNSLHTGLDWS
ncbi:MAG: aminopeptidase P family protein [Planctomycetaceae bacterium]|jgi:Xaa-Pro aminopeptidase|nr:aminopeptidase P family protein [Planctomycetaceae bacterium]MBT4725422.1 aminopeptidase P family protein [Planctomycetaceae bacterium]MBT5123207.1 aminopeptidase P family protein [Planctomycetaceae bacterium]MBT5597655.1 aminopeptidase P family protein [Planctomycetaceae bacterium]MBT5884054.1 aminopeptidase P family protein [Planctomycetaceae bacterium]